MTDWQDRAACHGHKAFGPEAWFQVRQGRPMDTGLDALSICQRVCPVSQECYLWYATWENGPPMNVIAGAGWWDGKGRYRQRPVEDLPGANPYRLHSKYQRAIHKASKTREATAA